MDPFVKKYIQGLAIIVLLVAAYLISNIDFRANEINDLLASDTDIDNYPYHFKVVSIDNGIATLLTPRNAQVSAVAVIEVLYPMLKGKDIMSDDLQNAQQELAYVQSKAANIVKAEPDISNIVWQLDVRWLENHSITVQ